MPFFFFFFPVSIIILNIRATLALGNLPGSRLNQLGGQHTSLGSGYINLIKNRRLLTAHVQQLVSKGFPYPADQPWQHRNKLLPTVLPFLPAGAHSSVSPFPPTCSVPTPAADASTHVGGTGAVQTMPAPTAMGGDGQTGLGQRHCSGFMYFSCRKIQALGCFFVWLQDDEAGHCSSLQPSSQKRDKPNESQTAAVYLTARCN